MQSYVSLKKLTGIDPTNTIKGIKAISLHFLGKSKDPQIKISDLENQVKILQRIIDIAKSIPKTDNDYPCTDGWMTGMQVAQKLGLRKNSDVLILIKKGLPAISRTNGHRVDPQELDKFVKENQVLIDSLRQPQTSEKTKENSKKPDVPRPPDTNPTPVENNDSDKKTEESKPPLKQEGDPPPEIDKAIQKKDQPEEKLSFPEKTVELPSLPEGCRAEDIYKPLGVSTTSIGQWINRGVVKTIFVPGRGLLITKESLGEFLSKERNTTVIYARV